MCMCMHASVHACVHVGTVLVCGGAWGHVCVCVHERGGGRARVYVHMQMSTCVRSWAARQACIMPVGWLAGGGAGL